MKIKEFHYAKIVSNKDSDEAGRVSIRIAHLHDKVTDDLLPWAKPFASGFGGSTSFGKSEIPEENSLVWVLFENERDFLIPYYIADVNLNEFHPHSLFYDNVKSSIDGFSSSYPDVKYTYYKNGICTAISSNSSSPEIVIYHPKGSYLFINSSGDILLNGATKVDITTKTDISLSSDTKIDITSKTGINLETGSTTTESMVLGTKLTTFLNSLLAAIALIKSTAPGTPVDASSVAALSAMIPTLLSTLNKNN